MKLSLREWAFVAAVTLVMVILLPILWPEPKPVARIAPDRSEDYWLFGRAEGVVMIGDSVVWGAYVKPDETLPAQMGYANLGINGGHPAALAGLIEYHGGRIRNQTVYLHCNPLWYSSPKHDLQGEKEFRFNHPELVPQFSPWIPCYKAGISERIGIVVRRNLAFAAWARHVQPDRNLPTWTMENPYSFSVKPSDPPEPEKAISWTERGMKKQSYKWIDLETSLQWASFKRAISILLDRGNKVTVLIGPFNEHMLLDVAPYRALKSDIEARLSKMDVTVLSPETLPSHLYADASHPLAEGYRRIAERLR